MNIIVLKGEWTTERVWLNGKRLYAKKSQGVWIHSPDRFSWGNTGSGAALLALAVLLEFVSQEKAVELHHAFKREVIAILPERDFAVSIDIDRSLEGKEKGEVR